MQAWTQSLRPARGQHTGLERQIVAGMRVFTVNKNKGCQANYYAGMHPALILCVCVGFFSVFLGWVCHLPETPTQQRYCLSDKRLNRLLNAYGATTASATAL